MSRVLLGSRPLRAVFGVVVAWIAARATIVVMMPNAVPLASPPVIAASPVSIAGTKPSFQTDPAPQPTGTNAQGKRPGRAALHPLATRPANLVLLSNAAISPLQSFAPGPEAPQRMAPEPAPASTSPVSPPSVALRHTGLRIDGSAWLMMRDVGSGALATGSELGGSQAGTRINVGLVGPLFATARISAPLARTTGREAAVGFGVRKGALGILAERRIALDAGGRDDFSLTAYGGVSDIRLPVRFRLGGYLEAGVVGRDGFADGAVTVRREVVEFAKSRVSLGGGVWGGIQPGVRRVDVGPQLVVRVPLGTRAVQAAAEWRQRVAGNAAPASGPSLTIGIDF